MGFTHVSLSSSVMPMIRIVPRGFTTSVDTYLTPAIKKYLQGFSAGFAHHLNFYEFPFHNYLHVCLTYKKSTTPKAGHVTTDMELFVDGESVKQGT